MVYNYFLVLETSFIIYIFLCLGSFDLPLVMPMGKCGGFMLF